MVCLSQTFVSEKEQCKHGPKAIFGKPIIDHSKFAHDRRSDRCKIGLNPSRSQSLLVTVPLGLRVASPTGQVYTCIFRWQTFAWIYLGVAQKFANRKRNIYFIDEISAQAELLKVRGVLMQKKSLRCGFADEIGRSPFLPVLRIVKAEKTNGFYLAKKNI